jgi:predicted RNase H-like HicB family nuclease
MNIRAYIHRSEGGGYWGEVREFPGCFSEGRTRDEVRRLLARNLQRALEVLDAYPNPPLVVEGALLPVPAESPTEEILSVGVPDDLFGRYQEFLRAVAQRHSQDILGPPVTPIREPKSRSTVELGLRLQLQTDQWLASAPTVLLAGMYAAATVSLFSVASPWVGFLAGAVPVAVLAVWAFWAGPTRAMRVSNR